MTLDGRTHPDQGRMLSLCFPLYSIAFFLITFLLPQGLLDINIDQAGHGILHGVTVVKGAWTGIRALIKDGLQPSSTQQLFGESMGADMWQVRRIELCPSYLPQLVVL